MQPESVFVPYMTGRGSGRTDALIYAMHSHPSGSTHCYSPTDLQQLEPVTVPRTLKGCSHPCPRCCLQNAAFRPADNELPPAAALTVGACQQVHSASPHAASGWSPPTATAAWLRRSACEAVPPPSRCNPIAVASEPLPGQRVHQPRQPCVACANAVPSISCSGAAHY